MKKRSRIDRKQWKIAIYPRSRLVPLREKKSLRRQKKWLKRILDISDALGHLECVCVQTTVFQWKPLAAISAKVASKSMGKVIV